MNRKMKIGDFVVGFPTGFDPTPRNIYNIFNWDVDIDNRRKKYLSAKFSTVMSTYNKNNIANSYSVLMGVPCEDDMIYDYVEGFLHCFNSLHPGLKKCQFNNRDFNNRILEYLIDGLDKHLEKDKSSQKISRKIINMMLNDYDFYTFRLKELTSPNKIELMSRKTKDLFKDLKCLTSKETI